MIILTHLSYSLDGLPKTSLEMQSNFDIIWRKACSVLLGSPVLPIGPTPTKYIINWCGLREQLTLWRTSQGACFFQTFSHNHLALNKPLSSELGTLPVAFFSKPSVSSIFWVANICRINLIFQVDKNFGVTLSEEQLFDWNTKTKWNVPWQCKGYIYRL